MKLERGAYLAAMHPRTELQTESWRLLRDEWAEDAGASAEHRAWEGRRRAARPQLVGIVASFADGSSDFERFRVEFDRCTRTSADAFGLRGVSGAMFLHSLARRAPDLAAAAESLRRAMRVPASPTDAERRLRDVVAACCGDDGAASDASDAGRPRPLQPARAVAFVTACWSLHDPERWPAFHPSARQALACEEGGFSPTGEPVADYLAFRDAFRSLARALGLGLSALEHLCLWHERRADVETPATFTYLDAEPRPARRRATSAVRRAPLVVREGPSSRTPDDSPASALAAAHVAHAHVQWLLAKLGRSLGCRVWIASNDHRRAWNGETLGSLSVPRLPPLGLDADSQRIVAAIDVVWLTRGSQVAAAFEVEHTTAVYSGILRMADLAALSPNLSFPLYLVAPGSRLDKVRRELSRPTFQALELHRRCGFFSSEALAEAAPAMMRWGSGPAAVERLAERVGDR